MAFAKQYTQRELDYIRDSYGTMSPAEMARELGRSERGVYKKIRDMRLGEAPSGAPSRPMQSGPKKGPPMQSKRGVTASAAGVQECGQDFHLRRLRELLWQTLQEARPSDVARLSSEYRETLAAIAALEGREGAGDAGAGADGVARILSLVREA